MSLEENDNLRNMRKAFLMCKICGNFFVDPIYLPCHCISCKSHLFEMEKEHNIVKCTICEKSNQIPTEGYREHKEFNEYIREEKHLTEKEKEIKNTIKLNSRNMQILVAQYKKNETEFNTYFKNYTDKLEVDIHKRRDELMELINSISDKLVNEKVKIVKDYFTERMENNKIKLNTDSIKKEEEKLLGQFNNEINIGLIEKKLEAQKIQMTEIKEKLSRFEPYKIKLNKYQFRVFTKDRYKKSFFGRLTDDDLTIDKFEEIEKFDCVAVTPSTSGQSSNNDHDMFYSFSNSLNENAETNPDESSQSKKNESFSSNGNKSFRAKNGNDIQLKDEIVETFFDESFQLKKNESPSINGDQSFLSIENQSFQSKNNEDTQLNDKNDETRGKKSTPKSLLKRLNENKISNDNKNIKTYRKKSSKLSAEKNVCNYKKSKCDGIKKSSKRVRKRLNSDSYRNEINESDDQDISSKWLHSKNDSFSKEPTTSLIRTPAKKKKKFALSDDEKSDSSFTRNFAEIPLKISEIIQKQEVTNGFEKCFENEDSDDLIIIDEKDSTLSDFDDGNFFLTGQDKTCKAWDLKRAICIRTFNNHTEDVCCVKKISNNKIATGSMDTTIKIWDLQSTKILMTLSIHSSSIRCLQCINTETLLSASNNDIYSSDIESGKINRKFLGHTAKINRIEILPDCTSIITCSEDSTIKTWDTRSNKCTNTISQYANCIKVLPNNRIAFGSFDKIKFWDLGEIKYLATFKNPSLIGDLELRDNGELISCSTNQIKLWSLEMENSKILSGHKKCVNRIKLLKDDLLVSISDDSTIKIWDLKSKVKNNCINTLSQQG